MIITLNGSAVELPEDTTIVAMLKQRGIDAAQVVVEVNLSIVPKNEFDVTVLHNGDVIEVLRFVGGG